ncbi:unnamed protein product [Pieris macdunnoughi]|uniref:Uncharacterized protein n=1 Tax=Pieris macdunnoughi TaxID=345717 RepID=A0A821R6I8_9NEOP|nr:unnamed protein product [Pieris macdunnoughi]
MKSVSGHYDSLVYLKHTSPSRIATKSSGMKISADSVKSKILQDVKVCENYTSAFVANYNLKNKGSKKHLEEGFVATNVINMAILLPSESQNLQKRIKRVQVMLQFL